MTANDGADENTQTGNTDDQEPDESPYSWRQRLLSVADRLRPVVARGLELAAVAGEEGVKTARLLGRMFRSWAGERGAGLSDWLDDGLSSGAAIAVLAVALIVGAAVLPAFVLPSGSGPTTETVTPTPKSGAVYTPGDDGGDRVTGRQSIEAADLSPVADALVESTPETVSEDASVSDPTVRTSDGSQTMRVEAVDRDGEVQLVLEDDRTHDGRWVAVSTEWLSRTVGSVPETVTITHESGDQYAAPVRVRDDEAVFYVDEFSSNTVTFSGEVQIGQTFTDGSTVAYQLTDLDAASNVSATLSGTVATEWDNMTYSNVVPSQTVYPRIAGNKPPTGPAQGKPRLEVTAREYVDRKWENASRGGSFTKAWKKPPRKITQVKTRVNNDRCCEDISYLVQYRIGDGNWTTLFTSTVEKTQWGQKETVTKSTNISVNDTLYIRVRSDPYEGGFGLIYAEVKSAAPSKANITTDTGLSKSLSGFSAGQTKSMPINLTTDIDEIQVDTSTGAVDLEIYQKERTSTTAGTLTVNGESQSFPALGANESVTQSFAESVLASGENNVSATLDTSGLSSDAPVPQVSIDYTHTAVETVDVAYDGQQFGEQYNISYSYASRRSNATTSIPFAGTVVRIDTVEVSINNSGSWTDVSSDAYSFDGSTVTVNLSAAYGGEIPAGTTVGLRANGSKVVAHNASVSVTRPQVAGETPLNVSISVSNWNDSSYLGVSNDGVSRRLHYLTNASWSNERAYAEFSGSNRQRLYLPALTGSGDATVRTLPLDFDVDSGEVRVRVPAGEANRTEPRFEIRPGASTNPYEVTLLNATDGESYILESITYDVVRDSGTANSPLTLSDDEDNAETLVFRLDASTGDSSGGGDDSSDTGGTGVIGPDRSFGGTATQLVLVALLVAGVLVAQRNPNAIDRTGDTVARGVGGVMGRVPRVGSQLKQASSKAIRGGTAVVRSIIANRIAALGIVAAVVLAAIASGVVPLPEDSFVLLLVAGTAIAGLVILRELGEFTVSRWMLVVVTVGATGVVVVSDGTPIEALVASDIGPILAIGGLYLLYRLIQSIRADANTPDETTEVVIETSGGGNTGGDD